jgi:hypothetical protein
MLGMGSSADKHGRDSWMALVAFEMPPKADYTQMSCQVGQGISSFWDPVVVLPTMPDHSDLYT